MTSRSMRDKLESDLRTIRELEAWKELFQLVEDMRSRDGDVQDVDTSSPT